MVEVVYVACIYLTEVPGTPFLPHHEQSYRRFIVLWRGFPCWFTRDRDRPEVIPSQRTYRKLGFSNSVLSCIPASSLFCLSAGPCVRSRYRFIENRYPETISSKQTFLSLQRWATKRHQRTEKKQVTNELDCISNQEANRCAPIIWRLGLVHYERPSKIAPTVCRAPGVLCKPCAR